MALPVPNLDDRDFQMLVDEAKRIVQQRCPEWTDHNVSDPGVTLIETFAWMTEQLIYRLNRVPDRNYIKFLELIGVSLYPPTAARTDVTFWLSGPQPELVTIPLGTQVATLRTETEEAIVFGTVESLPIVPAGVIRAGSLVKKYTDLWDLIRTKQDAECFQTKPVVGDSLVIGLSEPVPSNVIRLRFRCKVQGVGVDPDRPPLVWEAWTGDDWAPCLLESDATGGLNRDGDVVIHVPRGHATREYGGHVAAWVRAKVVDPEPGARAYQASPTISAVSSITIGGTVEAENASVVHNEDLGVSEGVPGQRFQLRRFPVLGSDDGLGLDVSTGFDATGAPIWERWGRVADFADSTPTDRHFVLDASMGEVRLGPAVRQEDGTLRRYGSTPDKDRRLRMVEYRTGGGTRGNVAAGALRVMKSSIPFVASVENKREGRGGVDGEDIENAKLRGPIRLRTRARAVTTEDYEHIAREAAPQVGRVRAVAAGDGAQPGSVRVQVVPTVGKPEGRIPYAQLLPEETLLRTIRERLEECRIIGTQLNVERVNYTGVLVQVTIRSAANMDASKVKEAVEKALYRYLNPLTGGPDGTGWPFGRPVTMGEVYSVLQRVPGVELIESLELFGADAENGQNRKKAERVEVPPNGLVFSLEHAVSVPVAAGVPA